GSPLATENASVNWLNCTVVPLAGWERTTDGGCGEVHGGGGPAVSNSTSSSARPFVNDGAPPLSMPTATRMMVAVDGVMARGVWMGVDVAFGPSVTEACATCVSVASKPRMTTVMAWPSAPSKPVEMLTWACACVNVISMGEVQNSTAKQVSIPFVPECAKLGM